MGRDGKPHYDFGGFSSIAAHFPDRSAAVLSPGSQFRLRGSDKTTLVTCMIRARDLCILKALVVERGSCR